MFQKIKNFLSEFDFIWSIPLAFIGFILFPVFGQIIFGEGFAMYPPDFFHAGIYSLLINVLFVSASQLAIFIHFPEVYNYYLKDFENLEPKWLKPIIFLFVFCAFYASLLLVWSKVV